MLLQDEGDHSKPTSAVGQQRPRPAGNDGSASSGRPCPMRAAPVNARSAAMGSSARLVGRLGKRASAATATVAAAAAAEAKRKATAVLVGGTRNGGGDGGDGDDGDEGMQTSSATKQVGA